MDQSVYQILLIEENENDADQILSQLRELDIECEVNRYDTQEAIEDSLKKNISDLIICNYDYFYSNNSDVLESVRNLYPNLPAIITSDSRGEEKAVDAMRRGASDYILKYNLEKLKAAVKRELLKYRRLKETETELKGTKKRYETLIQSIDGIVWEADAQTFEFLYVSPQSHHILGYPPEVWYKSKTFWKDHIIAEDRAKAVQYCHRKTLQGENHEFQYRMVKANGQIAWIRDYVTVLMVDGKPSRLRGIMIDITEHVETENERDKVTRELKERVKEQKCLYNISNINEQKHSVPELLQKAVMYLPIGFQYPKITEASIEFNGETYQTEKYVDKDEFLIASSVEVDQSELIIKTIYREKKTGKKVTSFLKEEQHLLNSIAESLALKINRIKQERKLRDIVENSTNLFYRHDVNHVITYMSPQSEKFFGCSPEEAQKRWAEFATDHPVNEIGFKHTMKAIETGEPEPPYELQFRHTNGDVVWARVHEAPIVEDGETVAMVGSLTDITEQKKYEEKLKELSLVASKTTDVIIMSDVDVKITWVNKAFEKLTGYSLKECVGKYPGEFLHGPETDPEADKLIAASLNEEKTVKVTILNYSKDGQKYWVDMTLDPFFDDNGNHIGNIAIQKNVTEKIEREKELQKSVERYEIVTKATSDTIWDADLQEDTVTFNSNIHDMFGYSEDEIGESGAWWLSKIHPEDRDRINFEFKVVENQNTDRVHAEYRFQCADGSYKYINDRAYVITDDEGNPVRMIGAMQDITKQREENLWLKLLESAIANSTESIAIIEENKPEVPDRNIIYVNDAFEKMTGFTRNEALGNSLLKFISSNTDRKEVVRVLKSLDRGENAQLEISYFDKNNYERWAYISFAPVRDKSGKYSHWICIGRDVTERRRRISELRESLQEKETLLMEIHHRVKNNLAVVSSMMQLQALEETNQSLQKKLYDSVSRIRTMVTIHEMLYESGSFSKLDFSVNLRKLVSMIIETIHNQKEIDVVFNCDEVELNVNQAIPSSLIINEIITNCIKHAFKGVSKGKITIELSELGNQIEIKVIDDGNGLPDKFNREDTTTLGLQLIDVLSKQMEATYDYRPINGQGTEFSIQFEKSIVKGIGNTFLTE